MEPFIGEIMLFGGNFAPRGYAFCDGQLLAINQNDALFSLLGTTYGGDGRTTFALPDLRGRLPVHQGHGPGLSGRAIGANGGMERVTLTVDQLPTHSHDPQASANAAATNSPAGQVLAETSAALYATGTPDAVLDPAAVSSSGGGQPHDNMMPYQVVHFCIALQGIYPSRS